MKGALENRDGLFPGWTLSALGDPNVCEINPPRPAAFNRDDDALTTFIPMAAVDERAGTITPCLQNGKHAVVRGLTDGVGFASTEFHVLRTGAGILAEWVHCYLRQPVILHAAAQFFTGSVGQQRVPADFLKSLEIPIPPLAEQRRVLALLNQQMVAVEKARATAEAQLEAAESLAAAHRRDIFNTPRAKSWPRRRLGDLLAQPIKTGISKPWSPTADKRCLTLSAIRDGALDFSASKPVAVSDAEAEGNWVTPGAFYVIRGNGQLRLVGRGALAPAIVDLPTLYPDLLFQVVTDPEQVDSAYLRLVWATHEVRADIEHRARTSAGIFKINQANLRDIAFPLPPVEEQRQIARALVEHMRSAERLRQAAEAELADIERLPTALLRRTFTREL